MYHTLQLLKPFGIAGFTASPLSEEFPYSRLLWEFLFRGSAANPTIAQYRCYKVDNWSCFGVTLNNFVVFLGEAQPENRVCLSEARASLAILA